MQSVHSITNPQSSTSFPSQMCTEADRGHGELMVSKEGYTYRDLGVCFVSSDWVSIVTAQKDACYVPYIGGWEWG